MSPRDSNWLPSGLELGGEWDDEKAGIGDYAEAVRQLRNLVHPANYLTNYSGWRAKSKDLAATFDVLHASHEFLLRKIGPSLRRAVEGTGSVARQE